MGKTFVVNSLEELCEMMCDNVLPLVEGKCPPAFDGKKWYYPEPEEHKDPEIREVSGYRVEDKEEFYNYKTVCKSCGTEFIAFDNDKLVRNYCPGCGKCLDIPPVEC